MGREAFLHFVLLFFIVVHNVPIEMCLDINIKLSK